MVLGGIPLFFFAAALLNRLLVGDRPSALATLLRPTPDRPVTSVLPLPARLLMFALLSQWLLPDFPLSLRVRQFCSSAAGALTIVAVVWLLIILNAELERILQRRISRGDPTASAALLRVVRRVADVVCVFVGLAVMLRHFGIDPTPTLAGVGVGGIAVALAAQKTLENVIAGASLIFDQAVKVGDFLKIGDVVGTVDHIGLRSTRLRTVDRTVVSIPNGTDRRRHARDDVGARQVLVSPGRAAALRDDAGAVARASSRDAGSCWPRIHRCASTTSACASTGWRRTRSTSRSSPTCWPGTGTSSSRSRNSCCSA